MVKHFKVPWSYKNQSKYQRTNLPLDYKSSSGCATSNKNGCTNLVWISLRMLRVVMDMIDLQLTTREYLSQLFTPHCFMPLLSYMWSLCLMILMPGVLFLFNEHVHIVVDLPFNSLLLTMIQCLSYFLSLVSFLLPP